MDARGHGRPHGDRDRARADRRGPAAVGHLVGRPSRRASATRGPRPARAPEGAGRASRRAPIRDGRDPLRVGVGCRDGHRLAAATGRTGDAASPGRRSQRPRRPGGGHGPATRPRGGRVGRVCRWPRPDRDRPTPRAFEDTATVALTATTSTLRDPSIGATTSVAGVPSASGVPRERTAPTASPTAAASGAVVRPVPSDRSAADAATETADPDSPGLAASSDRGGAVDDGNQRTSPQDTPPQDTPTAGHPDAAGLVLARSDTSRTVRADDADLRPFVARGAGRGIDGGREGRPGGGGGDGHVTGMSTPTPFRRQFRPDIDDEPWRESRNRFAEPHECQADFRRACACRRRSRPSQRRQPRLRDVPQGVEPGGDGRLVL